MQRRTFLAVAGLATLAAVGGCANFNAPWAFTADPLVNGIIGNIPGLSGTQAAAGIGSMLGLAQNRLGPGEFESVAKTLPNADAYLRAARGAGVNTDALRNVDALNEAFKKLNFNPNQARALLSSVTDWVGKNGGDAARSLMTKSLGV
jgi:hypothetical protein